MSVLELKNSLVDLISDLQSEDTLKNIFRLIKEASQNEDWWDAIPAKHQARILKSYEESFKSENWIDHEDMKKRHAKWLQK
jgi:hypothetical protein